MLRLVRTSIFNYIVFMQGKRIVAWLFSPWHYSSANICKQTTVLIESELNQLLYCLQLLYVITIIKLHQEMRRLDSITQHLLVIYLNSIAKISLKVYHEYSFHLFNKVRLLATNKSI